jgi:hypothetical protein
MERLAMSCLSRISSSIMRSSGDRAWKGSRVEAEAGLWLNWMSLAALVQDRMISTTSGTSVGLEARYSVPTTAWYFCSQTRATSARSSKPLNRGRSPPFVLRRFQRPSMSTVPKRSILMRLNLGALVRSPPQQAAVGESWSRCSPHIWKQDGCIGTAPGASCEGKMSEAVILEPQSPSKWLLPYRWPALVGDVTHLDAMPDRPKTTCTELADSFLAYARHETLFCVYFVVLVIRFSNPFDFLGMQTLDPCSLLLHSQ